MRRIQGDNIGPGSTFLSRNTLTNEPGTIVKRQFMNDTQESLAKVIESTGDTLDTTPYIDEEIGNIDQLSSSIALYSSAADQYVDSGAADAYVLAPLSTLKPVVLLIDGLTVEFTPSNTNTTDSTVNVNSIGIKEIRNIAGQQLAAGQLKITESYRIRFSFGNDYFILLDKVSIFENSTALINYNLKIGAKVSTLGFTNNNDGGKANYEIKASSVLPVIFVLTLTNGLKAELLDYTVSPLQVGYNVTAADMVDIATVDANWQIMKDYLSAIESTNKISLAYKNLLTLREIHAHWISGTKKPLGVWGDSTEDGTKTTTHTPSTSSDVGPFSVTINASPNAFSKKLEETANALGPVKTTANVYNGGFDSESYVSGFGLQHWYNTWFRGLSGSNEDWSDVAAIMLCFGTSDSANLDDTATVIANYSRDLECNIVDCYLRGVQPILQQPVATAQHFGNAVGGRNADQSLTIINAVQDKLKIKYGLELLSYSEAQFKALDNFRTIQYGDIFSPSANDQVHPVDLGHRINAGSIIREMNDQIVSVIDQVVNIYAGSPFYKVVDESLNVTDNVLTRAVTEQGAAVEKVGEYFYKFPASTPGENLLEVHIYCEKPTMLLYMPIDSSVEQPEFLINTLTHDDNHVISAQSDFSQPVASTFTKMYQIANLNYGLNRVFIKANAAGGEQKIGGLMAVPKYLAGDVSFYRESSGGTVKLLRNFKFRDNNQVSAGSQNVNSIHESFMQYMPGDNTYLSIGFVLNKTFTGATDFEIFSHFTDHLLKGTSYNKFVINDDTLTIFKVVNGVETQVGTVTTGGVGAAMVAGAHVMIRIRTRFFSPDTTQIQLHVNGIQLTATTVAIADLWTIGYGLEMNTIQCNSVSINSIEALKGDNINII